MLAAVFCVSPISDRLNIAFGSSFNGPKHKYSFGTDSRPLPMFLFLFINTTYFIIKFPEGRCLSDLSYSTFLSTETTSSNTSIPSIPATSLIDESDFQPSLLLIADRMRGSQ